jgi:hypothetical protein
MFKKKIVHVYELWADYGVCIDEPNLKNLTEENKVLYIGNNFYQVIDEIAYTLKKPLYKKNNLKLYKRDGEYVVVSPESTFRYFELIEAAKEYMNSNTEYALNAKTAHTIKITKSEMLALAYVGDKGLARLQRVASAFLLGIDINKK